MSESTGKPCRVCHDFKSWTQTQSHSSDSKPASDSAVPPSAQPPAPPAPASPAPARGPEHAIASSGTSTTLECPPTASELGQSTWTFLHSMASYYPDRPDATTQQAATELIHGLSRLYPCSFCAKHLRSELKQHPVQVQSRHALEQWMCEVHNEVNERLGKPLFDCSRVRERWRDGPADGSCD